VTPVTAVLIHTTANNFVMFTPKCC